MRLAHHWTLWCLATVAGTTSFWATAQTTPKNAPIPAPAVAQAAPDHADHAAHSDRAAPPDALNPTAPTRPLRHTPLPASGGIAQDSVAWSDANAAVVASAQGSAHTMHTAGAVPAVPTQSSSPLAPSHPHGHSGGQP